MTRRSADILAGFRALPLAGPETVLQGRRPLILSPHPDDETLGCGGLIAAACAAGLAPAVAILTDGSASHPGSRLFPPARLAATREQEAARAVHILGLPAQSLYFLRQPDGRLAASGPDFEALLHRLAELARRHACRLVIGPWAGDPHCDHQAAAAIAAALARRCDWPLRSYPVWGWLRDPASSFDEPRRSGWRLEISEHLPRKRAAIAAYASQQPGLVPDSPNGFRLPPALLDICTRPFEVFIA